MSSKRKFVVLWPDGGHDSFVVRDGAVIEAVGDASDIMYEREADAIDILEAMGGRVVQTGGRDD